MNDERLTNEELAASLGYGSVEELAAYARRMTPQTRDPLKMKSRDMLSITVSPTRQWVQFDGDAEWIFRVYEDE